MTFKLKEFSELKAHLDRTVDIMLKHNKKDTIDELHEPRRSELLMLVTALNDIITQINEKSAKVSSSVSGKKAASSILSDYLLAYNGIMLVARQHTADLNGKLAKRLADALGINEPKDKPTVQDFASAHVAANIYMQRALFANGDSRNGIKKDHIFSAIALEKLKELLEKSYTLEKEAQIEVIKALAVTEKSPAIRPYSKQTPETALAVFPSWEKLTEALDTLIANELADKNVATINELDPVRAVQLDFLETLCKQLKTTNLDEKEKIAVLAGTMHLVHQQIKLEYNYSAPENSLVYNELGKLLHIETAIPQDAEALLHAANQYIRYATIAQTPNEQHGVGKAIRTKHPFASIANFDLKTVLSLFQQMICDKRVVAASKLISEALKQAAEAEEALAKEPQASSKSWPISLPSFSGIFSTKKAKAVDPEIVPPEQATSSNNISQ